MNSSVESADYELVELRKQMIDDKKTRERLTEELEQLRHIYYGRAGGAT